MNAFPPELLHHHFACMVVAGLTPPSKPSAPTPTAATSAAASSSSASSAPHADTASDPAAPSDHPSTVFPDLTKSLHDILASRARNTLWDPARGRAAVFHTVFVDHSVRLPPLKTKPSARHVSPIPLVTAGSTPTPSEASSAAFAALPPRSPLSPLHPNSPQFPDGLIAPVWVRKHRELVPSVFVSFHCLPVSSDAEEVRSADEALIKLISDRRRTLAERGIKLTIVLLTEREMLDNTQLEARLSFIRRSSGLDSRASLFVLTPVTKPELGEFVSSLHSALFEPAADYYREHARRVKRKRTRYPPPTSTLQPIVSAIATLPPADANAKPLSVADFSWLSREGWIVRSEYKLAVFAELAGDMQEALLRYREAYDLLCNSPTCLLGSTLMLPPRTKRWAEAKVLADTLSARICKLLLYADDGEGAAIFFRRHLSRFTELSTGWGIGAMTFEYWSWLSKQYRLFGELVEHATRAVPGSPLPPFQLPAHAPPLPSKLLHPDSLPRFSDGRGGTIAPPGMLLPNANAVAVSTSPYHTLQSSGVYFYLAALCTVERRARFLRATSSSSATAEEESDSSPLSHERKVDHTAQLTEALTKAYDSFKRNRLHRAALFVAARIATAYHDGGQNEMALKFLERILKSYRKDEVRAVRAGLVEVAVAAAVGAGDRSSAARLLVEVLDPSLSIGAEKRDGLARAVKTSLGQSNGAEQAGKDGKTDAQEENGDASKSNSTPAIPASLFDTSVTLPAAEVDFGAQVPFQVVVRNISSFELSDVFSIDRVSLHIQSVDDAAETLVEIAPANSGSKSDATKPLVIDVGTVGPAAGPKATSADLTALFTPNSTVAVQGSITAAHEGVIRITKAVIHTRADGDQALDLELPLPTHGDAVGDSEGLNTGKWLLANGRSIAVTQRADPAVTVVKPQRFDVSLSASAPLLGGYVDECVPLTVTVLNNEKQAVHAWIDAILQPSYDGALDSLAPSPASSPAKADEKAQAVKSLPLGAVAAGQKTEVSVWLTARQAAGLRTVDVSLRIASGDVTDVEALAVTAQTSVAVAVARLFDAKTWSHHTPASAGRKAGGRALLDFDSDEETADEGEGETCVGLDVEMLDEAAVEVSSVELVHADQVEGTPALEEAECMGEWLLRDRFSFSRTLGSVTSSASLAWRLTWQRPSASPNHTFVPLSAGPTTKPLPAIAARAKPNLTLALSYPRTAHLQTPFDLSLQITNHHAARSFSLVITLDSDEHFTLAGTRRLTLPHLLPLQSKSLPILARLVPQTIGPVQLPNIGVRVVDPLNPSATLAVLNSHTAKPLPHINHSEEAHHRQYDPADPHADAEADEDEDEDMWENFVRFEYGAPGARDKSLPNIVVRL